MKEEELNFLFSITKFIIVAKSSFLLYLSIFNYFQGSVVN